MRLIFTILCFWIFSASANNYFVSNTGNDTNNGTSTGTSWKTIAKVNSTATSGDSVFFNRGNSWNEKLIPAASNIYYGSYGIGAKPIITGFQNQGNWTKISTNLWRTIAESAVNNLNLVLLNGVVAHKARYPNSTYLTFGTYSGDSIINTSLSGTPNYTGFEIAVRTVPWVIDVVKVQSQSGGTLHLSPHLTYAPAYGGNGYFFQNDSTLCDGLNEYSFNNATKALIVYSVDTPSVKISVIDTLVNAKSKIHIYLDGLQLEGANTSLIIADNYLTVNNSNLNYSGRNGLIGASAKKITVTNNSISNLLSSAVFLASSFSKTIDCDSFVCQNNYIKNIGTLSGMGASGGNTQDGILAFGNHSIISNNRIDSVGYIPINWKGQFYSIYNNHITNFCFSKSDGAAIYTSNGAIADSNYAFNCDSGSVIRANVISNGIGAIGGTNIGIGGNAAAGLYFDENVSYIQADSNTISNSYYAGLLIHNSNNIKLLDNTVVTGSNSMCLELSGPNSLVYNNTSKRNIFYANDATQLIMERGAADNGEIIDSNYFSRWPNDGAFFMNQNSPQTLTQWSGATIYDKHSKPTPLDVTYDTPLFYSNPSLTPLTIQLDETYTDFYGNVGNSVTIQPFKSTILFKTINQITPAPPSGVTFTTMPKVKFKIKSL